jgi:hypothetical protein
MSQFIVVVIHMYNFIFSMKKLQFMFSTKKLQLSQDTLIRLTIFVLGFAPIASLSLSTFNLIPLYVSGPAIVLPAIAGAVALGLMFRPYAPILVRGFLLGLMAVFLYDLTCRFPFIAMGVWPDFIPKIGNYLLHREHVNWCVGYLWRYIGNGGGMGLAFYAVYPLLIRRVRPLKAGLAYGVAIFCCLLATIYLSPSGRIYLFDPKPVTALLGLLGHIVFGLTLGYGTQQSPFYRRSQITSLVQVEPRALRWAN